MQNREEIKEFILKIENDFPINNWKINDIHIWPYIRIRLFFYLINCIEVSKHIDKTNKNNQNFTKQNFNFLKNILKKIKNHYYYKKWLNNLPKKDFVFLGGDFHRVNFKNKRYNRYFDVLIEEHEIENHSMYLEYGDDDIKKKYNSPIVYNFFQPLQSFRKYIKKENNCKIQNDGYLEFINFLENNKMTEDFASQYSIASLKHWFINSFQPRILFFETVLFKIKPKQIHFLCYYSENNFALLCVANRLNIRTIEMQHGPQSNIHMCYANWSNIPDEGYAMMPKIFWQWDDYSKKIVDNWIMKTKTKTKTKTYRALVIGNPWVEYWKKKNLTYQFNNYILYSLQPDPIRIEQLFPSQIIKVMNESNYQWFLRMHPRQILKKEDIIDYLCKNGVEDIMKINIENATSDPLPILLTNSLLHITHSSGVTLEADSFNVFTVIVNKIGLSNFKHLVNEKKATYIDYKAINFTEEFNKVLFSQEHKIRNSIFALGVTERLF